MTSLYVNSISFPSRLIFLVKAGIIREHVIHLLAMNIITVPKSFTTVGCFIIMISKNNVGKHHRCTWNTVTSKLINNLSYIRLSVTKTSTVMSVTKYTQIYRKPTCISNVTYFFSSTRYNQSDYFNTTIWRPGNVLKNCKRSTFGGSAWSFDFFIPRHNGQWPPTSKDFYPRSYPIHYFLILILEKTSQ